MSANGRHRRPRQAPALIVAAGVTGSAIAIPLLAASGASAADASTWDRVAECESGGMWSADLGNGYYGGLQLSQEIWDQFGGADFASRPDLASRSQQIAIAEKVLKAQGPAAWLTCAPLARLTNDGTAPDVDPGAAPRGSVPDGSGAAPSDASSSAPDAGPGTGGGSGGTGAAPGSETPSDSPSADQGAATGSGGQGAGEGSATPSAHPSTTPSPSSSATPDPGAADPAGSAGQTPGRHRGPADPRGAGHGNADETRESGRHASRGDGPSGRDGDVVEDSGVTGDVDGAYEVQLGDTLWGIAEAHDLSGGWTSIYDANEGVVGSDPDLILPGQTLDLSVK
ncbi:transglycosylase family protein [Streptomyces sp. NPDC088725]|uniref:transglycosylase family protein n=1 Tax=Streptomyces sp. NPDC088725 TaxID=3365873 RepID=UPI0037F5FD1F